MSSPNSFEFNADMLRESVDVCNDIDLMKALCRKLIVYSCRLRETLSAIKKERGLDANDATDIKDESEVESNAKVDAKPKPEPKVEPNAKVEPKPKSKPKSKVEPKPKVDAKPKSKPKSKADSEVDPEEVAELKKKFQELSERVDSNEKKMDGVAKSLELNNEFTAKSLAVTDAVVNILQNSSDSSISEPTNAIFGDGGLLSLLNSAHSTNKYYITSSSSGLTLT